MPASARTKSMTPSGRDRRVPQLRERCQIGYDLLRSLLERAGQDALVKQLVGLEAVDDILRHRPEVIPTLLEAAWQLRTEKKFQDLFLGLESGELVENRDQPIAPCGRTFDEVIQAHLYGAARLFFDRLEKDWATAKAREAQAAYKRSEAKKRASLTGRLLGNLKELTSDPPSFTADEFRDEYPGHGLYEILKPYLTESWQFALIPLYARLQTRQADALGDLVTFFKTRRDLEVLVRLNAEDISQARGYARVYAEAVTGVSRRGRNAGPGRDDDPVEYAAKMDLLAREERRTFDLLLTRDVESLEALKAAGTGAEATVRRLAPVFGDETWGIFRNEKQLQNLVNCPDLLLRVLGRSARVIPPAISTILMQIQDKALLKDLLEMALEDLPRQDLETYLSDPERKPVWNALPAKFNNNYRYQADAPSDAGTLKNRENLGLVANGIFESLRNGNPDLA